MAAFCKYIAVSKELRILHARNAYLQLENIAAPNLDTLHTFTVTDGTDTYTVKACALSYAYTSVKNGDSARQDLGKALYLYNQAANAYFDS